MLLICYLALRVLKRAVEVSQSGELYEYPVFCEDAGQQRMPHAWQARNPDLLEGTPAR